MCVYIYGSFDGNILAYKMDQNGRFLTGKYEKIIELNGGFSSKPCVITGGHDI